MKLSLLILSLALSLGVNSCIPISSAEDKGKPVDLSSICVKFTGLGNRDDKAPILLLHGILGFKELWYGLMQVLALKTGRKVCVADLRNHGDSPWSDEFNTVVMAKDVKRLLETLKIEKVVILGHSLGGKTAIQFTLDNPEKVEKLIVEDMRPNGLKEDKDIRESLQFKEAAYALLKAIPEGVTEREARRLAYRLFIDAFKELNETAVVDDTIADHFPIKCSNGKCSWKTNVDRLAKAVLDIEGTLPHSYGQFNGPVLFIYGSHSPYRIGDVEEEILEMFPKAELYAVKGASHVVQGFPEYKEKVLNFILKQLS